MVSHEMEENIALKILILENGKLYYMKDWRTKRSKIRIYKNRKNLNNNLKRGQTLNNHFI